MTIPIIPHPHDANEPCPGGCEDITVMQTEVCKSKREIEALNQRILEGHDQMTRFETRLGEGNDRMGRIEVAVATTAHKLSSNSADTSEILDIMREGKAFFRFAHRAGELLKWAAVIGTAIAGFYYALKGGK